MKKNDKLTNVKVDLKTGLPQIEIDRKRAKSLGVILIHFITGQSIFMLI